jgi:hypothetical protein
MSIWYQTSVTCLAANKTAVAKFFNLDDSYDDVRTDRFEFSFGGKNGPSLRLSKMMEQNPDLIFLINEDIECDTKQWFLMRFDVVSKAQQYIRIQDFGMVTNKVSKKMLEEYHKEYPKWVEAHLEGKKDQEKFLWDSFITNFDKAAEMLNRAEEYKEMVNPWTHFNVKNYVIEYECNYGNKEDPSWHKEWQGPHPMGTIDSIKERFDRYVKEGRDVIRNISIKEAEPR